MSDVIEISDEAVKDLVELIAAQGRLAEYGGSGPPEVRFKARLQKIVEKEFESGKTIRFSNRGGGWAVDISRYFDDQMLYLIVNTTAGKRVGVSVIDEGELEGWVKPSSTPVPQEQAPIPIAHRDPPVRPVSSDEPALIRVKVEAQEADGLGASVVVNKVDERVVPFGQVAAEVQAMLAQGIKPDDIEIWTRRQKPRVKVELE
jgi:hypothetical protein